jgi:hypothetical protein
MKIKVNGKKEDILALISSDINPNSYEPSYIDMVIKYDVWDYVKYSDQINKRINLETKKYKLKGE